MSRVSSEKSRAILTPDQRVRVFVSSTLKELAEERVAAAEAIRSLRLVPVLFELGARPHPPRDLYRSYLEQSDVFVGIYGESYGWIAPGMDISGLEDEYLLSDGKPRLIYVKRSAPERDERLQDMLNRMGDAGELSYRYFASADELGQLLADDLSLLLTERFASNAPESEPDPPAPVARVTPVTTSRFVGRVRELDQLVGLLREPGVRLITLCGPGGVGKTRLALEASAAVGDEFADGSVIVWLDAINDPGLVLEALAAELGVRNRAGESLMSVIADRLSGSRMLIILDNFEHVMDAAKNVSDLISLPTASKFLVTSRELLRLRGERVIMIDPLRLPNADERDPEALMAADAVALFVDRARSVSRSFVWDEKVAPAVREVVRRLDGIPLALELAAARVRVLPPPALLARLETALDVPHSRMRDLPERQRTIRDTIAWSYDLLDKDEQVALERFSVFAGSASLDAAEALIGPFVGSDVADILLSLVDKSLLRPFDVEHEPRLRALVSVRQYASERLAERGCTSETRDAHARFYSDFAHDNATRIHSPDQVSTLAEFEREHDNLQSALDWLLSEGRADEGLDLCNQLRWFWWLRGHLTIAAHWTGRFLALDLGSPEIRGAGLVTAGMGALELGELGRARELYQEAIEVTEAEGAMEELAWARTGLGAVFHSLGEVERAEELQHLAFGYFKESGHLLGQCSSNTRLGTIALSEHHYEDAESRFLVSLEVRRQIKDPWGTAYVLTELGELRLLSGDIPAAHAYLREALDLIEQVGYVDGIARVNDLLGQVEAASGEWSNALTHFNSGLASYRRIGNRYGIAITLAHVARAQLELDQLDEARRLAFEAFEVADQVGHPRSVVAAIDAIAAVLTATGEIDQAGELFDVADRARRRNNIAIAAVDPWGTGRYKRRLPRRDIDARMRNDERWDDLRRIVDEASRAVEGSGTG